MDKRRMCPHCRAFISSSDRVCPYCNTAVGPRAVDRRGTGDLIGGLVPHAHFITSVILLINFGLFAATVLFSSRAGTAEAFMSIDPRTLIRFGASLPGGYEEWWRLIMAGFLHGGMLHILMNSWVLFDLGAQVEEIYGGSRFLVFYFVSTVAGFAASSYLSGGFSVGASAALFGLIGAMIALGVHHPLGGAVRGLYIRWAIYGLLLGLLPGLHIDMAAHLGGLAAGFGIAYLAGIPKLVDSRGELLWRVAAGICIGLTALAFFHMYLSLAGRTGYSFG